MKKWMENRFTLRVFDEDFTYLTLCEQMDIVSHEAFYAEGTRRYADPEHIRLSIFQTQIANLQYDYIQALWKESHIDDGWVNKNGKCKVCIKGESK